MCAACGAIVFQRSAGRGTQRNASSSRPRPGMARKNDKKRRKREWEEEIESEKGNGGGDGVSNNASFMVLLCCVRKQIIECGGGSRMRHKIRQSSASRDESRRGEERERERKSKEESERGI